ncbi:MAG: OmpA family protein [Pseudomonadota bacterium]|nr:OmpA family protein [Pseudomonadota bacterium]
MSPRTFGDAETLPMLMFLALSTANALDADTFKPVGSTFDLQGGLQVMSPSLGWSGSGYAGLGLVYAHNPVVQVFDDGTRTAVVDGLFATRLGAGYNVGGKVRIDLDIPLYPYVGAADPERGGFSTGDMRLDAVFPVLQRGEDPVGLAIIPIISLPTGNVDKFTGSGFGAGLTVSAGIAPVEKLFIDANLGAAAAPASTLGDFSFGSSLIASLGAGYLVSERLTLGAELDSNIALAGGVGPYNKNPVELHAYGTYGAKNGLVGTLGLGTGLVAGVGAPDVRVLAQLGYRIPGRPPVYDVDKDGIVDGDDACVNEPEDMDRFEDSDGCPETDNDKDGIVDLSDACPTEAEDRDAFEDTDGCPETDNDKDGLVDSLDACPNEPGPAATAGCPDTDGDNIADNVDACPTEPGPERTKGCPDRDSDLVADKRDKCPDEPKDPREDPERSDGCPKRVFVSLEKIEIMDKIFFDTNKTTIKKESFSLLQEIATTLNANDDILSVEVAGHTDSDGKDDKNLTLSKGRAEAVVKWLTTTGKVDPTRLYGAGYGETKPIETNATAVGKANNRRVEFVIKSTRPRGTPTVAPKSPE